MSDRNNRLIALAADIRAAHQDSSRAAITLAERALAAGTALIEAKRLVKHGQWQPWLHENCGLSDRTARRYMALVSHRLKTATVAVLGIRGASEALGRLPMASDEKAGAKAPKKPPVPLDPWLSLTRVERVAELMALLAPSEKQRFIKEVLQKQDKGPVLRVPRMDRRPPALIDLPLLVHGPNLQNHLQSVTSAPATASNSAKECLYAEMPTPEDAAPSSRRLGDTCSAFPDDLTLARGGNCESEFRQGLITASGPKRRVVRRGCA